MIPENYPYKVGYQWYSVYRVARIKEVLNQLKTSGHKVTINEMEKLQNDVLSIPARELITLLRHGATSPSAEMQLLLSWNADVTRESPAAALFEIWFQELSRELLRKVAPESSWGILQELLPSEVVQYLSRPDPTVFGANPESGRDQLLVDCLQTAAQHLIALQGPDPKNWSWGKLHVVQFRHPLDKAPNASFMDLGPVSRPGDDETVDATGYDDDSFAQRYGASYREIIDTSDWDKSVAINVPGQSGQPGSVHYSDLLSLWSEGKYFPLLYSRPAIETQATDKLVLVP